MPSGDRFYYRASKEIGSKRPNKKLVFDLLSKASNYENTKACYALATWYLHGEYVKNEVVRGFQLLKLATKGNIPSAFYDLAVCFETGKGTKKNHKAAFENYMMASLLGYKQAIYEVGRCYYYGFGVTRNLELAEIWLEAAKFWKISL